MEQWGTPTDITNYEYAPSRSERKDDSWNDAIATERRTLYQKLQKLLNTHLGDLQAYTLAVPGPRQNEWDHPNFFISILVGKTSDRQWLCLAPTVPDQMGIHCWERNIPQNTKKVVKPIETETDEPGISQILPILNRLNPLLMYGYYHGGYNYDYYHQIISAVAPSKSHAISNALSIAQMVVQREPELHTQKNTNRQDVIEFMNQNLCDRNRLSISFWDLAYYYEIGKTPSGDWVGVRSFAEFEYNP
jgi:hypothetical protein